MIAIIYTLILTHLTMVAVCVYLHRGLVHRSMEFHPALEHFFRFYLWLTDGVDIKSWVATHRIHHRFTDVEGDPHSPVLLGIKAIAVTSFFQSCVYRYENRDRSKLELQVYGSGTPDDWMEKNIYCHQRLGLVLMLIINVLLFGRVGVLIWLVQVIWTPLWSNSVVTGFAHYLGGYQHPDCKDNSRNLPFLGFFLIGDQLHSNHHANPSSAKLSQRWFEFDLGWMYIKLMSSLGLVKIKT